MALFRFEKNSRLLGITTVDNLFLMEYMPKAPENYVKVYLYGLMACSCADAEDIAGALNLTEQEISEAFFYWQGLGIVRVASVSPLIVEYAAIKNLISAQPQGAFKYGELAAMAQRELKGRMITPNELSKIIDWVELFGITEEAVGLLIKYGVATKGNRVRVSYLDSIARDWADNGVTDFEKATEYISLAETRADGAQQILKRWRMARKATADEEKLYQKWTGEWGFDRQAVFAACMAATGANNPSFKYLDSVLEGLYSRGAVTEADIGEMDKRRDRLNELCRLVFLRAGLTRPAKKFEREIIERFVYDWGVDAEVIFLAAEYAKESASPFSTIKKLAEEWHKAGKNTVDEAKAEYESRTKSAPVQKRKSAKKIYSDEYYKNLGVNLEDM